MELTGIYQSFSDETRLRIIHLLMRGPLCVCHLQELLKHQQVHISKHLAYLRTKGLVSVRRHQSWMIYSLPEKPKPELVSNLQCLQECVRKNPVFKADLRRLAALGPKAEWLNGGGCCEPKKSVTRKRNYNLPEAPG